jgi:phosphoglycerol transferase MdoB-like AlkP superfamily enzyme
MVAFPTTMAFNTLTVVLLVLAWSWQGAVPRRTLLLMLAGLAAALALSFVAYYNLYAESFLSRTLPALAGGTSLGGNQLWPGGVPELLGWTAGYVVNWLPLLLLPIAILYVWPARNQKSEIRGGQARPAAYSRARLAGLLLALFTILVLGVVLNLRFDMIGKHLYYTMPATAIASGLILSRLWGDHGGRPYPRALAALVALSVAWAALAFMAERL